MNVLKPYIHVEIQENKKSAIIVDAKINLLNKQVVVVDSYEGSTLKKGNRLILKGNCRVDEYKDDNGQSIYFIDERDVIAAI